MGADTATILGRTRMPRTLLRSIAKTGLITGASAQTNMILIPLLTPMAAMGAGIPPKVSIIPTAQATPIPTPNIMLLRSLNVEILSKPQILT